MGEVGFVPSVPDARFVAPPTLGWALPNIAAMIIPAKCVVFMLVAFLFSLQALPGKSIMKIGCAIAADSREARR
jgi:hypothetical protein